MAMHDKQGLFCRLAVLPGAAVLATAFLGPAAQAEGPSRAKVELQRDASETTDAAARAPAGRPPEPPPAPATAAPLSFSAFFDVYYAYNFNKPRPVTAPSAASTGMPRPQNDVRYYDWYHNQLGLSLAELTVRHKARETSFLLDLDFGQQAEMNAQFGLSGAASGGPTPGASDEVSKHVGQAIVTYEPESMKGLIIEAGKMPTHLGLETTKSKDNWNYSRSLLFSEAVPIWHAGVHVGYAIVPNELSAHVYAYNGWNTLYLANGSQKVGAQVKWNPSERLAFVYGYVGGPEQANNDADWKQVHDFNATWTVTPTFSLAVDTVTGWETNVTTNKGANQFAEWHATEFLAKWQATPWYSIAPRIEIFEDASGYALGNPSATPVGDSQTIVGTTVTQAFRLSEGFETRVEARWDKSSSTQRFVDGNGTRGQQVTALVGLLYVMP